MTHTTPGAAPELLYDGMSECNGALIAAGLPLDPPKTGVFYTREEIRRMGRAYSASWYRPVRIDPDAKAKATANVAARRDARVA